MQYRNITCAIYYLKQSNSMPTFYYGTVKLNTSMSGPTVSDICVLTFTSLG